jgi:hypothetical protein
MNDFIQINRFSELHNGENIFFCKTDFLQEAFRFIRGLNREVILISGNSDYCITDELIHHAPHNIKKWFCQNRYSDNKLLESIPLGIENTSECRIDGHGYVWDHAQEKYDILKSPPNRNPTKFIYSNFNTSTNPPHRNEVKQKCIDLDHITWQKPNLSYQQFVEDILDYEAIICPQGNDRGDNHRIYEVLYLGRVPITFNKDQYDYLHHLFPTVLINSLEELEDQDNLRLRVEEAKNINKKSLTFQHWKNIILEATK